MSDAADPAVRHRADPEADAVVAAFCADHPALAPREVVGAMVEQLRRDPEGMAPAVRAYLLEGPPLPSWVDDERVRQGQRFFRAYGISIGAALFCASLPEAYAAADGVDVLAITTELVSHPRRRIAETGRLIIDVMALDGGVEPLAPGGHAYRSVRGVRLMHAAVRALVREHAGPSWVAAHGEPVNQQDLVGTLLTFTSVVYRALDQLGIEYDPADADAHLHVWCVVGHLLGIDDDLLPWSRDEADALAAVLRARLHRPSESGRVLTAALLEELERSMPAGCRKVPRTLVRHLVGDATADLLGVPPAAPWRRALPKIRQLGELGGTRGPSAATARQLGKLLGRALFAEYVDRGLRGERAPFDIPPDLARAWRLRRSASAQTVRRRRTGRRDRRLPSAR